MSLKQAKDHWSKLHFTGIGGVGMAALALICDDLGIEVTGSDLAESAHIRLLRSRGISVAVGDDAGELPGGLDLLVYSSAVPEQDAERQAALAAGVEQIRRGEFLGALSALAPVRIAVAGSHGKTTTTAMIAHVLRECGIDCAYAVGGLVNGWSVPAAAGDGEVFVFEVDESDGTQVAVAASHGVITNLDDDHCWSVGGVDALYQIFAAFANRAECMISGDLPLLRDLLTGHSEVCFLDAQSAVGMPLIGAHNRMNGAMACAIAERLGFEKAQAVQALASFGGVDRRLSVRLDASVTLVEDYAHHPVELAATLAALRERWPGRPLRLVFQPHRYERVARYGTEFAAVLATADWVVVTRPFDAWIDDAGLADPRQLLAGLAERGAYTEAPWPEVADRVAEVVTAGDLVIVAGAGSITQLPPLLLERFIKMGLAGDFVRGQACFGWRQPVVDPRPGVLARD